MFFSVRVLPPVLEIKAKKRDVVFTCRPVSNSIPVKKFVFEKWLFEHKRQWIVMSLELKNIYLEEKGELEGVTFWWILFIYPLQLAELVEKS